MRAPLEMHFCHCNSRPCITVSLPKWSAHPWLRALYYDRQSECQCSKSVCCEGRMRMSLSAVQRVKLQCATPVHSYMLAPV